MVKMEVEKYLIQTMSLVLRVTSSSSIFLFAPAWVTTISIFFWEMGRKTKTERVLEKENFELGKNQVDNLGLTRFGTLFEGQGTKNKNFRSGVKEWENLSKRDNET